MVKLRRVFDPSKRLVVYCGGAGCQASHNVAIRLKREMQLDEIYVLLGGYPRYQEHLQEIEQQGGKK